jgi:general secretion pathway protein B
MSYILDALKKSERQRPPGQVPDLFTVQGPMKSGKPRRPLRAAAIVAAVVVAAAIGGRAWFGARDRQAQAPSAQSAAPRLPDSGAAPPEATAPAAPIAVTPAAQPASPPAEKIPAASPPAPLNAGRRTPGARSAGSVITGPAAPAVMVPAVPRASPPVPKAVEAPAGGAAVQPEVPPSPGPPAAGLPAATPPPAAIPPAPEAPAAPIPTGVEVPPVAPEVPPPASAPAAVAVGTAASPQPAADAPPADGRVVSLEELPESVRKDLGKFTVSGHVWSEEPALRLLTVQDRIVREGGEAAPGVRLEEVTQTGAVFSVRGWRFRTGF